MRRLSAGCAVVVALSLGLAACGGEDDKDKPKPTDTASAEVASAPAPPEDAGKAYEEVDPEGVEIGEAATGNVIATSGFDIKTESFAFPNYGKSRGPMLRPQEIRETFGDGVCVDPAADPCVLTPAAERWRLMQNANWEGGHCYGFSTLSLKIHRKETTASVYGGDTTHSLRIADQTGTVINPELHADLTRSAAMQTLASIQRKRRRYTPTKTVEVLKEAFASGEKDYVLSFFFPGEGGHAVVPIGIEDMGDGKFDILLYDNNFPYVEGRPEYSDRRMHIDTVKDRWDYTISVRPDVAQDQWHGEGLKNPLALTKASDQALPQPCPFCDDAPAATPTTISLTGDAAQHGHLRITDAEGNVTGWNGKRFVNGIPGAKVRQAEVIRREFLDPEPIFDVPSGKTYTIEVVDIPSGAPESAVHVSGPGVGVGLAHVSEEGTRLTVAADGKVAVAQKDAGQAPELTVAASDDREVRLVPDSRRVSVDATQDKVKIAGGVGIATATSPSDKTTSKLPSRPGSFDLDDAVGAGS
jgi:hypothetical protein